MGLGLGFGLGLGVWARARARARVFTGAGEAVGGHGREASEGDDPHDGREHPRDERRHVGEDIGLGQEGELADDLVTG